jgi:hypothetical protein
MRPLIALLFIPLASAQITVTPTTITAQAATLTCTVTAAGAVCLASGKPYLIWTPPLTNGADSSLGTTVWRGHAINASLSIVQNVEHWYVSAKPNGGVLTQQSGVFGTAPPTVPLPICDANPNIITFGGCTIVPTVGTLVGPICHTHGTGFAPSFTTPLVPDATGKLAAGAVMLPKEPGGDCALLP